MKYLNIKTRVQFGNRMVWEYSLSPEQHALVRMMTRKWMVRCAKSTSLHDHKVVTAGFGGNTW